MLLDKKRLGTDAKYYCAIWSKSARHGLFETAEKSMLFALSLKNTLSTVAFGCWGRLGKWLQPRRYRDGKIAVSIDTEPHLKQQRKHVLEFFQKDPWPVRVGVLAMWLIFLLTLVVFMSGLPTSCRTWHFC